MKKILLLVIVLIAAVSCRFRPEIRTEIQDDLQRLEDDIKDLNGRNEEQEQEAAETPASEESGDDDASFAFDDSKCTTLRGSCKNPASDSCSGSWQSGKCGGGADRKCCVPQASNSGFDDSRCTAIRGTCKNPAIDSCGNWQSGKCGGGADRKCCAPGSAPTLSDAPLIWRPPADVEQKFKSNPRVLYSSGGPWNGGRNCAGQIKRWPSIIKQRLLSQFPGLITSIGGYSCRQNTADASKMSEHGSGRALDIMITPNWRSNRANVAGDAVANYLTENASSLGIQYLIWNRGQVNFDTRTYREYCPAGNCGKKSPHIDHLHVEFSVAAADRSQ